MIGNAVPVTLGRVIARTIKQHVLDHDLVIIADVPDDESMSAIALAIAAGGALKSSKTTKLLTGAQGVEALKKAEAVAKTYRPAR